MVSQTINFNSITGKVFPDVNLGQNYVLPLLTDQLCTVVITDEQGAIVAEGTNAKNTRVRHVYLPGVEYTMTITETRDDRNSLLVKYKSATAGAVTWAIIISVGELFANCKTIALEDIPPSFRPLFEIPTTITPAAAPKPGLPGSSRGTGNVGLRDSSYQTALSKVEASSIIFQPSTSEPSVPVGPGNTFYRIYGRNFGEVDANGSFSRQIDISDINPNIYAGTNYTYEFILRDELNRELFRQQQGNGTYMLVQRVGDQKKRWTGPGTQDIIDQINAMGLSDDQFAAFPFTSIRNVNLSTIPFEADKNYVFQIKNRGSGMLASISFKSVLPKEGFLWQPAAAGIYLKLLFRFF